MVSGLIKPRPTSQAGEGRISLTISRFGFGRQSRDSSSNGAAGPEASASEQPQGDGSAVDGEELAGKEHHHARHHHHHPTQKKEKVKEKDRRKSKSRDREEKTDKDKDKGKGKAKESGKERVPDRECLIM